MSWRLFHITNCYQGDFPGVDKAMGLHYRFIREIRDHLSIQSVGAETLFHYFWVILISAFVG